MKVLLLVSNINLVGGIERVVCMLANCFYEELNYDVEVVSIYTEETESFFQFNENIKITHENLKFIRYKSKFKQLKQTDINIRNVLKDKSADIILTFFSDISMSVLKNKRYCKSKVIVTEHIDYFECSKKGRIIRNLAYRKADALVVLTNEANRLYSKFLKNIVTIPNMISFTTDDKSKLQNKRIISIGRLENIKGFDLLIDIFNKLNKVNNEWSLDIIGDGSEKENLLKKIKHYNLEGKVKIKPFTKNIEKELLESSIYAFTSRHEGFGLVLIEAQECGLPCVSFDITPAKEIISNNENGIIIKSGDLNEYTKKLLYLIDNYDERIILGSKAKQNAKKYHKDNISIMWEKLLKTLVE